MLKSKLGSYVFGKTTANDIVRSRCQLKPPTRSVVVYLQKSNFAEAGWLNCNLLIPKRNRILSIPNFGIKVQINFC
jgi:hypothetical protein